MSPAAVPALSDPEAVLRFDLASCERAWREVRFGLRVLAVLFGGLVVLLCLSAFSLGART